MKNLHSLIQEMQQLFLQGLPYRSLRQELHRRLCQHDAEGYPMLGEDEYFFYENLLELLNRAYQAGKADAAGRQ